MTPFRALVMLVAFVASAAAQAGFSADDWRRIHELKHAPAGIPEALRRYNDQTNVGKWLRAATRDADRYRHYLGNGAEEPEPFRHYLLDQLITILRTRVLPQADAQFEDYLQALFAAFRDTNPQSTVRPRAYRMWAHEVLPVIGTVARDAAISALVQRCRQPNQRMDAVPALLLAYAPARQATFLRDNVLGDTNPEVRFRAIEALNLVVQRQSAAGRMMELQVAAVPFLRDTDPRVRQHAERFLADLSDAKARTRALLRPQTIALLIDTVEDETLPAEARVSAVKVLGGDLMVDFFDMKTRLQTVPAYRALVKAMRGNVEAVRREAAKAFMALKPFDAETMNALIDTAFGEDAEASGFAFTALGASDRKTEGRIRFLPDNGQHEVLDHLLDRLEVAIATPSTDPDGARRRDAAELLHRNPPTDAAILARLAKLVLSYGGRPSAVDRHVRATLMSTLIVPIPDTVDFAGVDDPRQALDDILASVAALPVGDRRGAETMVLGLRPTEEAVIAALSSSTGDSRRLLVRQVAGYSAGRLQEFTNAPGADAALAQCCDDPELARILLDAFAKKRDRVNLRNTPLLLDRVLRAAERPDPLPVTNGIPAMHVSAAAILDDLGRRRGRHLAIGNGADHRGLRTRVLLLAENAGAPAGGREAAQRLRGHLQARPDGVNRCAEELRAAQEAAEEEG